MKPTLKTDLAPLSSYQKMMLKVAVFFGIGHLPKAPGTWATLATLPLALVVMNAGVVPHMIFTVLVVVIGIQACEIYEQSYSGHDRSEVVIDEVAGLLITMVWLPISWKSLVAGFLVFRFLDILKPFPIGYLDKKVSGGVGVMADDIAAGVIGNILLQVVLVRFPWLLV